MIPDVLYRKLDDTAGKLRALLSVLSAFRRSAEHDSLKSNAVYSKALRTSGKLSCDLSSRLDTLRDILTEEEFVGLLSKLGCTWDEKAARAIVK